MLFTLIPRSSLMQRRFSFTVLFLTSAVFLHAAVLVDVSFENLSTGTLPGGVGLNGVATTGETGLTGNWAVTDSERGSMSIASPSFAYDFGGGASWDGGTNLLTYNNGFRDAEAVASLSSAITGQDLWVGFLFNVDVSNGEAYLRFGGNSQTVNLGLSHNGSGDFFINPDGGIGGDTGGTRGGSYSAGTVGLIVGRLNWGGSEYTSADLWVNPDTTPSDGERLLSDVDISAADLVSINSLAFFYGESRSNGNEVQVDRFVFAEDVTDLPGMVPEPRTVTMLLTVCFALCVARYRR